MSSEKINAKFYVEKLVGNRNLSQEQKDWFRTTGVNYLVKSEPFKDNPRILSDCLDYVVNNKDSRDLKRLRKRSVPQMVDKHNAWVKRLSSGKEIKPIPPKHILHNYSDGYSLVQLLEKKEYEAEGSLMRNCILSYYPSVIVSLRDPDNMPRVTIHIENGRIQQAREFANSSVDKYERYLDAINFKELDYFKQPHIKQPYNLGTITQTLDKLELLDYTLEDMRRFILNCSPSASWKERSKEVLSKFTQEEINNRCEKKRSKTFKTYFYLVKNRKGDWAINHDLNISQINYVNGYLKDDYKFRFYKKIINSIPDISHDMVEAISLAIYHQFNGLMSINKSSSYYMHQAVMDMYNGMRESTKYRYLDFIKEYED